MKLKRTFSKTVKPVIYFGIEINIPTEHNFVATDSDGFVYSYKCNPVINDALRVFQDRSAAEDESICAVDLEGLDWKETLVEIA